MQSLGEWWGYERIAGTGLRPRQFFSTLYPALKSITQLNYFHDFCTFLRSRVASPEPKVDSSLVAYVHNTRGSLFLCCYHYYLHL